MVIIEIAFASDDFSFDLVAEHSSIETPTFYKLAAMWSSQEGSLLLWAWVLSIAASVALYATRHKLREIVPWATAVMMGDRRLLHRPDAVRARGRPLRDAEPGAGRRGRPQPAAAAPEHDDPPADALLGVRRLHRALRLRDRRPVTRRLDAEWIRSTRRFALIAWAFLGFGLLLGARWSYTELGWGGYWAWDPVENAALMPWLIGTAFLHSIMVQEKRGMLKVWNACLIVATFSMALLGTFLVRSGRPAVDPRLRRQHRRPLRPRPDRGRRDRLDGADRLPPRRPRARRSGSTRWLSRESVFLVNNLLLVALTAVVFWGTFFPLISELFTGDQGLAGGALVRRATRRRWRSALVLFTGIGPLLAWRRVSWASAKRVFRVPLAVAAVAAVALVLFTDAAERALGVRPLRLRRLRPDRAGAGVLARRRGPAPARPAARCRRRWSGSSPATGVATAATSSTSA